MRTHWEVIDTRDVDGFTVKTAVAPEYMAPEDSFEFQEDIDAVRSGAVDWFMVRVSAHREGVELAETYLGGCAYANALDFVAPGDGCWEDMAREVIREARATTQKLAA